MAAIIGGMDPTRVDTTAQFPLGVIAEDPRGGDFTGNKIKYVFFGATVTVGQAVILNMAASAASRHASILLTSAIDQPIEGICIAALVPSGQFGWIHIAGRIAARAAATIVVGAALVSTAVAGELDDLAITPTGPQVTAFATGRGIRALTTTTATFADVLVQR